MALTIGGIIFLIGLVFLIYYGLTLGVKKSGGAGTSNLIKCSLCQQRFDRAQLVERQVGDSKLYYFCETCIRNLHDDLLERGG